MIDIVIVEDDKSLSDSLELMLELYGDAVRILKIAPCVEDAVKYIDKLKPALVFLDVMLPDGTGFDVLSRVKYDKFKLVFTTSYAEYAIRAFELSALHYLLKPIKQEMLDEVFHRYEGMHESHRLAMQIGIANTSMYQFPEKIMLRTNSESEIYQINDIIRIEADQNYSIVYMQNNNRLMISRNIQYFEGLLGDCGFCRVHNSHIINIKHIKKVHKGKHPFLILSDDFEIRIPESRRNELNDKLSKFILAG